MQKKFLQSYERPNFIQYVSEMSMKINIFSIINTEEIVFKTFKLVEYLKF